MTAERVHDAVTPLTEPVAEPVAGFIAWLEQVHQTEPLRFLRTWDLALRELVALADRRGFWIPNGAQQAAAELDLLHADTGGTVR